MGGRRGGIELGREGGMDGWMDGSWAASGLCCLDMKGWDGRMAGRGFDRGVSGPDGRRSTRSISFYPASVSPQLHFHTSLNIFLRFVYLAL